VSATNWGTVKLIFQILLAAGAQRQLRFVVNALQVENFRFCPFWEMARGSKSRRLASDKAYPQLGSSYSRAEMLRSSPVRWCLLGRIAAPLV
jgi:hypothetical protein